MIKAYKNVIPVYNHTCTVVISDDSSEVSRYLRNAINYSGDVSFDAKTFLTSSNETLVVFKSMSTTIGVVAHESYHVAENVYRVIGESNRGEEVTAYLINYVGDMVSQSFKNANIKID